MWDTILPHAEFVFNNFVNHTTKKTLFEDVYRFKPQKVLDLVPLPQEARVSEEGEAFVEHVRRIHAEVCASIKTSNDNYEKATDEHQRFKEFSKGDLVMVYLRKERYLKGTYHKMKSRKIGPCKILKKISSNALWWSYRMISKSVLFLMLQIYLIFMGL
ncbi:hypothetical protein CFOL_v3_34046 [Cephalotus follicularis]|uniref:Tf2-1-like SH3-like domain-containing protein n=1 Tax=Cephalotus follicularis TaxID=3775 RepID=A0A1Q3DDY9_CEPFO|nr:hypothetical protein CFOL_v3_34046 [Cephalotus follicularis]